MKVDPTLAEVASAHEEVRCIGIRQAGGELFADLAEELIREGVDLETARKRLLEAHQKGGLAAISDADLAAAFQCR